MSNLTSWVKPKSFVSFVGLVGLVGAISVAAQAGPLEDVVECAGIVSDAERLACYDAGVTQLRASGLTSEQIAVSGPMVVQQQGQSASDFGARSQKKQDRGLFGFGLPFGGAKRDTTPDNFGQAVTPETNPSGQIDRINETVDRVEYDYFGKFKITLSNGQVWKQNDDKRLRIDDGYSVEIRRGVVGGYLLRVDSKGKAVRVKRVE